MERLTKCTLDNADELAKPILQEIKSRYGMIPNFYSALGINGAVMKGYLEFEANLEEHSLLSLAQREMISLAVANYNGCEYCVSGHSFSGKRAGLSPDACIKAQQGKADNREDQLLLDVALALLQHRGKLPDSLLTACLDAGISEAKVMQVCAWSGLNNFSNWVNNTVQPKIDFPRVPLQPYTE
ncbi:MULTISPECIES: carboxymuconolactone decarboxylase family protein [Shewanella]|uniref:Alkyl hydroperoxide reductase AhpD n=2 Tax=Bacteria TaxID=2 RepID=A0AAD1K610_9GAMM|nr:MULTISPECIES: carboxymuconolactone decarboxylase family protein [Shewanella]AYV12232.1 carboxymuconolactone decarboxylase family protein [Shewanella algae]MBO2555156.1 carboxymuconolactone decarboxylase family protein [Shewanella algae]MBO2572090.1 carboxymuconolactone decarboxylase family protein [Shewanella algae]MBO2585147.1 carboxymuconolactone decarboxylase family protein [Shewanella algae]MBO2593643.1 carboxymuconolactone decarboxylase family protein [Shewanella algae]